MQTRGYLNRLVLSNMRRWLSETRIVNCYKVQEKKNDFTLTIIKQALKTRLKPREARASISLGLMQCSRVHCAEHMKECGMLSTALLLVKDLSRSNLLGSKLCWSFLNISNGETKALRQVFPGGELSSPRRGGEGRGL